MLFHQFRQSAAEFDSGLGMRIGFGKFRKPTDPIRHRFAFFGWQKTIEPQQCGRSQCWRVFQKPNGFVDFDQALQNQSRVMIVDAFRVPFLEPATDFCLYIARVDRGWVQLFAIGAGGVEKIDGQVLRAINFGVLANEFLIPELFGIHQGGFMNRFKELGACKVQAHFTATNDGRQIQRLCIDGESLCTKTDDIAAILVQVLAVF